MSVLRNPSTKCFYTTSEFNHLRCHFGHRNTDNLMNLLRKADLDTVQEGTRNTIQYIAESYDSCEKLSSLPHGFKFTLRDDSQFNSTIYVNLLWIDKKTILHVVDESTRYQAARWVPTVSAEALWKALYLCWIDVYMGPPDVIAHNTRKNVFCGILPAKLRSYVNQNRTQSTRG